MLLYNVIHKKHKNFSSVLILWEQNEFLEILLELCEEKLWKTTEKCIDDDVLFAHLIDETMIFDKELQAINNGPEMNCIKVLLEEPYLKQWIDLEKKRIYIRDIIWFL